MNNKVRKLLRSEIYLDMVIQIFAVTSREPNDY